jgi:DNA-binding IclR family transcriptional regulator
MIGPTDGPIRSVDITCSVIEALNDEPAGVTTLSRRLEHSKSTIHEHLKTLNENHFVVRDGDQYRLSIRMLDIAESVRSQFENYDVIRDEVEKLAEEIRQNAQFAIEEHGRVRYLYKASGEQGVRTVSSVGTGQPMHSTALGKSILSHFPEDQVRRIIDNQGLDKITDHTITNQGKLMKELDTVRDRGHALDDEENLAGLRCVAAPVVDSGTVVGSVSVSGPSSRIRGELFREELPEMVESASNVIELNSKYG